MGMLGTKPRSSASVASSLTTEPISPAPYVQRHLFKHEVSHEDKEKGTQEDSETHLRAWAWAPLASGVPSLRVGKEFKWVGC